MATLVFYAGQLIDDQPMDLYWIDKAQDLPDGAYLRFATGQWVLNHHGYQRVDTVDVPKEIRLMAHLIQPI